MASDITHKLRALYGEASKHSAYQSIPDFVSDALGYSEKIDQGWRGDWPRLRYLLQARRPRDDEHWGDFGANTGFFTLTLAHRYPRTHFTAIEANPKHADFIWLVAKHFGLANVEILDRAIGLRELQGLPCFDFLLHLNVLHHAGHDFDREGVRVLEEFPAYAVAYLGALRDRAKGMLFQLGSNWGGDKAQPLIGAREDTAKLRLFSGWIEDAGWGIESVAYPERKDDGTIDYRPLSEAANGGPDPADFSAQRLALGMVNLDLFPGEFYRRPLFACKGS